MLSNAFYIDIKTVYFVLSCAISCYFLSLGILNCLTLSRSKRLYNSPSKLPQVAVCIPVRNESAHIAACLDTLLQQDYPNYSIHILNDQSEDNTWSILQTYAAQQQKITIHQGKQLPKDWYGKPHAMQQLLEHTAETDQLILFTDADTRHQASSISFMVKQLEQQQATFISGYSHYPARSLGEKILIPSLYIMMAFILPLFLIKKSRSPMHSFAIGSLMLIDRKYLLQTQAIAAVKHQVNEDMLLARNAKKNQRKVAFVDAQEHVQCLMYSCFRSAFFGISKNIFAALDKHSWQLILTTLFLISFVLLPIVIGIEQAVMINTTHTYNFIWPTVILLSAWSIILLNRKQPLWMAVLYPALFSCLTVMGAYSAIKSLFSEGIAWKGRCVK